MATGENTKTDDGSLAFLNIPRDEKSRSFNCDETTQSKLVNTSFWVCDFKQGIAPWLGWAKHSNSRHLLKTIIKQNYHGIL